jgi:excisionase family DNA binding protein
MLYSPEAAAAELNLSRTTIYTLMDRGDLPSLKIGRSRRITREALEAYVASLSTAEVA